MRHGTTVWNEKGICQGRSQNRLSKNGISITQENAKILIGKKIDLIICSPLFRTIQTANLVCKVTHSKKIKDERITEIDQGYFTGKKVKNLTDEELSAKNNKNKEYHMESPEELHKRVKEFFDDITSKYISKNILVITHGAVATYLESLITNTTSPTANTFKNSEIKKFII